MSKIKRPTGKDEVSTYLKLAYGTGHVLNDLTATFWFTYLLIFFHEVLGFSNSMAGWVMVVGQLADGCATVFIGYFQDKGEDMWLCRVWNKRKVWHLVGTIGVSCTFPFVFNPCLGCSTAPKIYQFIYYSFFIIILQFTWPCAQISHLAIITELTSNKLERTALISYRYSATVLSSLAIYLCMWALLGPLSTSDVEDLGPNDAPAFRNASFIAVGAGSFMALFFQVTVRIDGTGSANHAFKHSLLSDKLKALTLGTDKTGDVLTIPRSEKHVIIPEDDDLSGYNFRLPTPTTCSIQTEHAGKVEPMKLLDWLREPQLYQVGCLYLCARLFVNLSQSYLTLYLDVTLKMKSRYIAIIPMVMLLSGLLTSPALRKINGLVGRKGAFLFGCIVGLGASAGIWFGGYEDPTYTGRYIYIVAVCFGVGGCCMLITSISAIADFIGNDSESGALVYAITSLIDKLFSALAFGTIQDNVPDDLEATKDYYKDILVYTCGGSATLILLLLVAMIPTKLGKRKRDKRHFHEKHPNRQ